MRETAHLDWDTILDYIESEQAALLIGPELMHFDGQTLDSAWRSKVFEKFQGKISYFYEEEGFFLFPNKIVKNDASRFVRRYISERAPEEEAYKKIAQLKFPVVVSTNPDTYLSDVAYRYGIQHRFSYFKSRSKAVEDVEAPQKDLPLFYNLCGTINDDESIILDYEDVFRLIASSVGTPGLPPKLLMALSKVRIFFFLGFQFEKWYTQLLLRLICGQEQTEKYAANKINVESNVSDFLLHQFQIEFLDEEHRFLDVLLQKCAQRNLLRPLAEAASPLESNIIRLIQTSTDLYAPLEELRKATQQSESSGDTTLLMGRYNALVEEKKKGTIDSRDFFVEYNKIIDGILNIIRNTVL